MNEERASISVIVPCYCCSNTIVRAVDSVVAQTLLPYELILVDDGSPDGGETLQLLKVLVEKYSHILHIELLALSSNQGASVARNSGWDVATQSYIAFLDADDAWCSKKLEIQYQWMIDNPAYTLSGHKCGIWNKDLDLKKDVSIGKVTPISKLSMMLRNSFSTPTVMMKREASFRFRVESLYAEDYLLWQQVICSGASVARIELELAYVYKGLYGAGGLSGDLWAMEKYELSNYWILRKQLSINTLTALCLTVYSFMKYFRRLFVLFLRKV